jgi:hypothetical protein
MCCQKTVKANTWTHKSLCFNTICISLNMSNTIINSLYMHESKVKIKQNKICISLNILKKIGAWERIPRCQACVVRTILRSYENRFRSRVVGGTGHSGLCMQQCRCWPDRCSWSVRVASAHTPIHQQLLQKTQTSRHHPHSQPGRLFCSINGPRYGQYRVGHSHLGWIGPRIGKLKTR